MTKAIGVRGDAIKERLNGRTIIIRRRRALFRMKSSNDDDLLD